MNKKCLVDTTDKKTQKLLSSSKIECEIVFPDTIKTSDSTVVQIMQPSATFIPSETNTIHALTSASKEGGIRWLVVKSAK